jgi:hypothetical protein
MEFKNYVNENEWFQDKDGTIYTKKEDDARVREMVLKEIELEKSKPKLNEHEQGYRRGYSHGFQMCLMGNYTQEDMNKIRIWSQGWDLTGAPYSPLDGVPMNGLTEDDEHRFFANQLNQTWNDPK